MGWLDDDRYLDLWDMGLAHQRVSDAPGPLKDALDRFRLAATPATVAEVVETLPAAARKRAVLEPWLDARARELEAWRGQRPELEPLSANAGGTEVFTWLIEHGLGALWEAPLMSLPGFERVAHLRKRNAWQAGYAPLWSVFKVPTRRDEAPAFRKAAVGLLNEEASRAIGPEAKEHRERLDALVATASPEELGIREFWPDVVDAYAGMAKHIGVSVMRPSASLELDGDNRRVRHVHTPIASRIPLSVDDIGATVPACRYTLELLQHLIIVIATPGRESRAAFAVQFGTPLWERRFQKIDAALASDAADPGDDKNTLVWRVQDDDGSLSLRPERARLNKAGTRWITRIEDAHSVPTSLATDPVDAEVLHLMREGAGGGRDLRLLRRLVGHPRVLGPGRANNAIEVRAVTASLRIARDGERVRVEVRHGEASVPAGEASSRAQRRSRDGYWAELRDDRVEIAALPLGATPLLRALRGFPARLPADALPDLLRRVASWSAAMPVEVDASIPMDLVPGDRRPVVQLDGDLQAVRVRVLMRHLPDAAPAAPGEGATQLYGMEGDRPVRVDRDLDAERAAVRETWKAVPLESHEEVEPWTWQVQGPARVLEVLQALKERDGDLRVGWTDRLPILRKRVEAKAMSLVVSSGRDWFGIRGTINVDGQTAQLDEVLAADAETPGFLRLKDGSWAALTRELAEAIRTAADASQGEGTKRRVTPLHTGLIEDLASAGVQVDAPEDWLAMRDRIEAARRLDAPVPEGLKADLRPYQRDGFRWLASLAHWAPGAVLADDMGLGKTVQAIALLLRRAAEGPALVVVPTSLGFNWVQELQRFSPELRPVWFHGSDRTLSDPAPGEVWITTWGVLALDADRLAEPTWRTLIFDEAHAIKNPDTRRAKAARRLKSDFRLALTGTPLENHLGELWALFDAMLPGLLGARATFHERFRLPIEQRGDTRRRKVLSRMIQPFLLRRTKGAVARDLPDRIEIIHRVARSGAERSLYDEARRAALSALASGSGGPEGGRFKILAALQQLRQLACHPALVDPGSPVASSKLHHVCRLACDLKAQGHRMLIFSQFTSHLDLVQPALVAKGVSVLRLDGSTPAKQRERLVDAFQAGEADAFLISLKAGGVGLNLTAATYVLHLDPWWNPASEDQATDRAHRIGQTEAVTVIRIVAQGTIEEQILSMHDDKRALAAEVLSGTGDTRRLDVEALRGLLTADPESIEVGLDAEEGEDEELAERAVMDVVIAEPFGAPSSASTAEAAPANGTGREGPWLAAFLRSLGDEQRAGRITEPTHDTYARTAVHLEAWHGEALPREAEALTALGRAYVEAVERGEVPHRADRHNAGTVVRRMVRWLGK